MPVQFESFKHVSPLDISVGERIIPPTPKNIALMKESFGKHGQLTAIAVMPVTHSTYRLVAGATRLAAAIGLHWEKIRVEVGTATEVEFELHEILENLDRRNLSGEQRKMLRKRKRDAERRLMEQVKAAKGGRGKKGGMREAARQMGISHETARNRGKEKLSNNLENLTVSDDQPSPDAAKPEPKSAKFSVQWSRLERAHIEEIQAAYKHRSLSDAARAIVRGDAPAQNAYSQRQLTLVHSAGN